MKFVNIQIDQMKLSLMQDTVWKRIKGRTYNVNGYAILFAIEAGLQQHMPNHCISSIEGILPEAKKY